jgi:DNA-binding IclR family transcriptional regulator
MTNVRGNDIGYQTRSLIRALAILDAFGPDRPTLSVNDFHKLLDIPKPTVSRLASVLEQHGLLRGDGHAYQLGPKTFELGSVFAQQYGLPMAARPAMEALAQKSSQTSSLGVLSGHLVVYLLVVRPPRPIHHVTRAGSREYAHPTGLGKALLAALTPAEVDGALGDGELVPMTPHTICDRQELHAELERTRHRGYALDQEEFAVGLRCVAIHVDLPRLGPVAISVSGPAADYSSAGTKRFYKMLREASAELERAFAAMAQYPVPPPGTPRTYDPFADIGATDVAFAADGQ